MIHASFALARRLETGEAWNARVCAETQARLDPALGAAVEAVCGGQAIFVGPASPLSRALGLGMAGPVDAGSIELLDRFFRDRGAAVGIELCPLAHPSLVEALARRGYYITEFDNVLVRPLDGFDSPPGDDRVRRCEAGETDLWAETVGRGFFEHGRLTAEELAVGRMIFQTPGTISFLACDGEPAAGAAMSIHEGLAMLFADSTRSAFRGRGLHRELIRARLRHAASHGCDLATASTAPGSISQRNYERLGFQVVYTKINLVG